MVAGAGTVGGGRDVRKKNNLRPISEVLLNKHQLDSWNQNKINDLLTLIVSNANYLEMEGIENKM